MIERKKSPQLSFGIEAEKAFIPESLLDKSWGKEIVSFLEGRNNWKDRPFGPFVCFVFSSQEFERFIFNPSNWQVQSEEKDKKYAGCLVLVDDFFDFSESILENIPLRKKSPFYVFERANGLHLDAREKEKRIDVLKGLGLVEVNILTKQAPGFWVWEARVEKNRVARKINLLDKEKRPRAYNWARKLWKDMADEYARSGFKVVSGADSEIVARLKASKNPPNDLGRLKMGWGVEIKNPSCGCHLKISLNGDLDWIYFCGDETHHTIRQGRTLSKGQRGGVSRS